ncbi:Hypothetical predicted protein [Mytilus galloprovincialis]|uniref:Uncharacterized protein n=1 Tax=Mytilus galloprovincialis TaxID=29158 RepID=A0A8B6D7M0_MYTGA|nr:Hypothetical predicted protein [Mytilus galloprovincialis]
MWYIFLKQWNCVSFFYDTFTTSAADFELFTDAPSTLGFGGGTSRDIGFVVLGHHSYKIYLILICLWLSENCIQLQWRQYFGANIGRGKRIVFHCDNESTVNIINKGRSKVQDIMKLMRKLTWLAAINNFTFSSKHIPGVKNVIADSLSRFDFQTFRKEASGSRCTSHDLSALLTRNVELTNSVSCLLKTSIAPRTRTQYECGYSAYATFLRMTGVIWLNSDMPPLTEESLIHFATHCFKNLHLKCSTIKMYICGIRYKYLENGRLQYLATVLINFIDSMRYIEE